MNIFDKNNFTNEKINFLNFDESFSIGDSNSIIFGFNGIGKTSLFKCLSTIHPNYVYLDYDNFPKFTSSGKKLTISTNVEEIISLDNQINALKSNIGVKNKFKNINITKPKELKEITSSKELLDYFNEKTPYTSSTLTKEFVDEFNEVIDKTELPKLISLKDRILSVDKVSKELADYSQQYILKIIDELDGHYDETTNVCPLCGCTDVNLFEIIKTKKEKLSKMKENTFYSFSSVVNASLNDQEKIINKIIDVNSQIDSKKIVDLLICDFNYSFQENANKQIKELEELKEKRETLIKEQIKFYTSMSHDKEFIKQQFEKIYIGSKICFDDQARVINIEMPRDVITGYSTGEKNELCILIKTLSFIGSDSNLMIIDDPLSSYDFIHQYRIIFRIARIVEDNNKKIVIFTHNIETINILNSQINNKFKYFYIEKYNNNLYLQEMNLPEYKDSILSLESLKQNQYINLLVYRESQAKGYDFEGHKVFHFDGDYTFTSTNDEEKVFDGLNNKFLIDMIDNLNVQNEMDFKKNTINKVLYLCAIRIWIEKRIYQFIQSLPEPIKTTKYNNYKDKNTTLIRLMTVQDMPEFKAYFPNYSRELFMVKKVMLNQDSHYRSQIIPFNFAINISIDNLIDEISEIKNTFAH